MRSKIAFFIVLVNYPLQMKIFGQNCVNPNPLGCGSVGQCTTIELNLPQNNNCTSIDYSAGENIKFKPGFSYKATPGKRLHAWIEKPITNPTYTTFIDNDDFDNREIDTDLPVGTIAGSASVSPSGAATYTIPIYLPPGTAGMQPSVSLEYNSQSRNGIAGYGWNVAGISSISRVQKNIYHDVPFQSAPPNSFSIQFNNSDQFAMDGNRLIPCPTTISSSCTTNTSFCLPNTYFTEVETYSRITIVGTKGSGTEWFNVETKDGLVIEYGRTEDSRIVAPPPNSPNILVWNISKIYDTYGNYISYKYKKFSNNIGLVQTIVDRIEYTGNSTTSPYNTIKFLYNFREDQNFAYTSGSRFNQFFSLKEIQVLAEEEIIRKYSLSYTYNEEYSFLSEIKEKGIGDIELNSTIFKYPVGNMGSNYFDASVKSPAGLGNIQADYIAGDYNGDGKSDLVSFPYSIFSDFSGDHKIYSGQGNLFLNTDGTNFSASPNNVVFPTGFSLPVNINESNNTTTNNYFGPRGIESTMFFYQAKTINDLPISGITGTDFNGDGRTDLLLKTISEGQYAYVPYLSNGNGFSPANSIGTGLNDDNHSIAIGDFNGDKISDVFIFDNTDNLWNIYFFNSSGTSNAVGNSTINASFTIDLLQGFFMPIDFNGDGKTELLSFKSIFQEAVVLEYQSPSTLKELYFDDFPDGSIIFNGNQVYAGDFNGDGISDILAPQGSGWVIGYGTGKDFQLTGQSFIAGLDLPTYSSDDKIIVGDFNGDGFDDILEIKKVTGHPEYLFNYFFSFGLTFFKKSFNYDQFTSSIDSPSAIYFLGDFSGDGAVEILLRENNNNVWIVNACTIPGKYLLSGVLDGFNRKTTFEYDVLSSGGNFYAKGSGGIYPLSDFQGSLSAVSKITMPDGIGGNSESLYSYEGAKIHQQGKGFITFSKISAKNNTSGITSVSEYEVLPFFYFPGIKKTKTVTNSPDNQLLSEALFTNAVHDYTLTCPFCFTCNPIQYTITNKRFFPYASQVISKDYLRDITVTANYTYDLKGNLTSGTTNYGSVETQTVLNTLWVQKGSWIPNRLKDQTITLSRTGDAAYEIKKHNDYNDNGKLTESITINDNDPVKKLIASYAYDNATGNPVSSTIGTDQPLLEDRTSSFAYDSKGRFVTRVTNPLLQFSEAEYDARWGKPVKEKSISGLENTYQYDAFGRLIKMKTPDNIETNYSQSFVTAAVNDPYGNPLPVLFSASVLRAGSPASTVFYDIYGRELKTQSEGLTKNVNVVRAFNNKGQLSVQYSPYFDNELPEFSTVHTYFNTGLKTGLPATVVNSLSGTTNFNYSASGNVFTSSVTSPAGQASQKTDAAGKVIEAGDNGGTLTYSYYSHGKLKEVKQGDKQLAFVDYDFYARQKKLKDLSANEIDYDYNAYGELSSQKDKLGNEYTLAYDKLGRITTKTGPDGVTSWQYYTSGSSVNLLQSVTGPNGIIQQYSYDNLGRLSSSTETIESAPYATQYAYDQFSNISQITYPSGFRLAKTYNNKGYLTELKNGITSAVIWSDPVINALGQYTGYNNGNTPVTKEYNPFGMLQNYSAGTNGSVHSMFFNWDEATGNLESRTDMKTLNFESFTYDNLNRLRTAEVMGQIEPQETDYYANGNIKTKSRIGSYTYDAGKLNAVEQVGNPAGDISLATQDITYTPFNKTATISENFDVLTYTYGPDQQRKISELKNNGTTTKKIIYSGMYEKITIGSKIYEVHYISCGAGLVGVAVKENGGTAQLFYVYTDHLGSIVKITNSHGNTVYEQNFDAWGRERNPDDWTYTDNPDTKPEWLIRGFTAHEHLDEFALINMNGRVYDPLLGRMNSPDNVVQSPFSTQSYNRYSYAFNNPLLYIDPSGDDPWDLLFRGFRFMNEGVNYAEQRANGNAGYSYDMHYAGTGQLPNDWRNNPNVVLGPNGYPMGPNGEYSSNDLFGGEVLPEYETAYETYLWGHWYTRFPDVPSQAPRRDYPIYKTRAVWRAKSKERDIQNLNNFKLTNPQFINLPEGGGQFVDFATILRQPGASQLINLRVNAAGNPLPNANVRRDPRVVTPGPEVLQFHATFSSGVIVLNNPTAIRDKGNVASQAFDDFFNNRLWNINPNVVYFRWPEYDAYPSGNPGGWQYGMILVPRP